MTAEADAFYREVEAAVIAQQQASISWIQRRWRIGFLRAAQLIDELEVNGIVSPAINGKRDVLVTEKP